MNTAKSLIRIATLVILGLSGLMLLLDSMENASELRWALHILVDLPIAALLLYLFHRLYQRWSATDKWLKAYNRWIQPE